MGAALALAVEDAPDPPSIDGLILLAPAIWGRDAQGPAYSTALWMAAHSVPWMTFTGEGLEVQPSDNIAMLRALGRDPLVIKATRVDTIYGLVGLMDRGWDAAPRLKGPALVVYGAHEEIIPPDVAMQMIRRLPPGFVAGDGRGANRVAIYPQGYHMLLRDLHGRTVQQDVAAWIADPTAHLPSGNEAVAARLLGTNAKTVKDAALPAPPTLVPEAAGGVAPTTGRQAAAPAKG
jgi:acylglycerol lipase